MDVRWAIRHVRDPRALGVAIDHQIVTAVIGYRCLEIGDSGAQRLVGGEVEQAGQLPPRLVWPSRAARTPQLRRPDCQQQETEEPTGRP